MISNNYKIGFARTALLRETVITAQEYCEARDWEVTKERIAQDNLYQARAQRSGAILFSEVKKRLSLLSFEQCEVIADDREQDVRHLVWIALCKQYPFIGDFSTEVLAPAYVNGRQSIGQDDYGYFFNSKAEWHPELDAVSDKTRSNARQALFQMMRQCDLITDDNQLIPQMISSAVQNSSPEADLDFIPGAIRL